MEVNAILEEKLKKIRSVVGPDFPDSFIERTLSRNGGDPDEAIKYILENPGFFARPLSVVRTVTSTGARVSTQFMQKDSMESEEEAKPTVQVKEEPGLGLEDKGIENRGVSSDRSKVTGTSKMTLDEFLKQNVMSDEEYSKILKEMAAAKPSAKNNVKEEPVEAIAQSGAGTNARVKEEPDLEVKNRAFAKKARSETENFAKSVSSNSSGMQRNGTLSNDGRCKIEDGDFPIEPDWFLVGRTVVTAMSTTKGNKLADNEIVNFAFPSSSSRFNAQWIVRFSTKRSGEIGRLPMEWAKCVVPLVNSQKVKILGRCIAAPGNLHIMQEILLYVSFYIHSLVFSDIDTVTWKLEATHIDSTIYPLLTLFKLLKITPYQKAEFTPEELDSRKRLLKLEDDPDESTSMLPLVKRRKGSQQFADQNKDDQTLNESSLTKLVGAVDMYNLDEMEPPPTLTCDLRPYQKQALFWMSELEKGIDVEKAAQTLHPCWSAYRICDERATSIYVNIFSGESTTKFPTATQMARGGILADAMGLRKTVMTIALILARMGKGCPDNQKSTVNKNVTTEKKSQKSTTKARGGTLIVCPMALLGQWKEELEIHSEPESISIFVHYGGDRTNNPEVLSGYDVVLTTYGVLTSAYKSDGEFSIYHRVDWYRVVLDEAHTIKSSKTQTAQAAFTLNSYCRWCLTGTPPRITWKTFSACYASCEWNRGAIGHGGTS